MKNVLTVAGSDSSGGAGIQADLKTMCALGVYGMSVVTAVTVQNTQKVYDVQEISPAIISGQIEAVYTDIPVHAVKIGMVSNTKAIEAIYRGLLAHRAANIVLDPVMVSKSGYRLLRPEAEDAMRGLVKIADLVTPNIPEAEILAGYPISTKRDMEKAAVDIRAMGAKAVLLKGGHLEDTADDYLLTEEGGTWLCGMRIVSQNTHGTGCTLSSAVACSLAKGQPLEAAAKAAKEYVVVAMRNSLPIGKGVGPLGHMVALYKETGKYNREEINE